MAIRFPDFHDPALEAFAACARIASADENDSWPSRSQTKISRLESSQDVMVRLILNRQHDPDGLHVHVDTVRARAFRTIPKVNSSLSEISDLVCRCCAGANLFVRPKVEFILPKGDLPPKGLISLLMGDQTNPSAVRMTGASYEVGSTEISWRLRRRGEETDKIEVTIESENSVQFSETYLVDAFEYVRGVFRGAILEDTPRMKVK